MKHLSDEIVEKFRAKSLNPEEFIIVDEHLAQCETCRKRLNGSQEQAEILLHGLTETSIDSPHLEFEQIAAWVEGSTNAGELNQIQDHLAECSACCDEVKDLQSFRDQMSIAKVAKDEKPHENIVIDFRAKSRSFWFTAAAAVLAAVSFATVVMFRNRVDSLQSRVHELETENIKLKQKIKQTGQVSPVQNKGKDTLILNDGAAQFRLEKNGRVTANLELPKEEQNRIRKAIEDQNLELSPILSDLIGRKEVLMGESEKLPFILLNPIGTAVASSRPEFRWEALTNAMAYRVRVYNPGFQLVIESPRIFRAEWTPSQNLPAGIILNWHVIAEKAHQEIVSPVAPFPDAKFIILKPEDTERMKQLREKYSGSHLLLGLNFLKMGLLDDAEKEITELQRSNPESPEAANLLLTVRKIRRH